MALYFFHLRDGTDVVLVPEGRELADPSLLPAAALKEARAIIGQDALAGYIRLDHWIDVRDEAGELVHQLHFKDAITIGS